MVLFDAPKRLPVPSSVRYSGKQNTKTCNKPRYFETMSRKRKRAAANDATANGTRPSKQAKTARESAGGGAGGDDDVVEGTRHVLLAHYYPQQYLLRKWVLMRLPASSRLRRRKIESVGIAGDDGTEPGGKRAALDRLLNTTRVAWNDATAAAGQQGRGVKEGEAETRWK
jgi:hypothetical protein